MGEIQLEVWSRLLMEIKKNKIKDLKSKRLSSKPGVKAPSNKGLH